MKILKPYFFIGIFPCLCASLLGNSGDHESITIVDIRDVSSSQIADPPRTNLEMEPVVHTSHPKENFSQKGSEEIPHQNRELWEFLREAYQGSNVDIYLDGPFTVVRFPDVHYPTASTRMPATLRRYLKPLSEAIQKFQFDYDLLIEGHADGGKELAYSSANWAVAYRRSDRVRRELLRFPIPAESVGVVSRSSGKGRTFVSSEQDRRVEFVFSPKRQTREKVDPTHGEIGNPLEQEAPTVREGDNEEWISLSVIQILDARNP